MFSIVMFLQDKIEEMQEEPQGLKVNICNIIHSQLLWLGGSIQENKNIKNETRCRDGVPKSLQNCLNVFIFLFLYFDVNLSYSIVEVIPKPKKNISFKCNHNPRT